MADAAAATADASDGEQIELEDSSSHTVSPMPTRHLRICCERLTCAATSGRASPPPGARCWAVVPDERVADCSQDELVSASQAWIRLREAEAAFRQALAAAERVVVVHGSISSNAMRALAARAQR